MVRRVCEVGHGAWHAVSSGTTAWHDPPSQRGTDRGIAAAGREGRRSMQQVALRALDDYLLRSLDDEFTDRLAITAPSAAELLRRSASDAARTTERRCGSRDSPSATPSRCATRSLDAAVHRPRASVLGQDAYPDLLTKAAALLHSLSRDVALGDGQAPAARHVASVPRTASSSIPTMTPHRPRDRRGSGSLDEIEEIAGSSVRSSRGVIRRRTTAPPASASSASQPLRIHQVHSACSIAQSTARHEPPQCACRTRAHPGIR